MKHYILVFLAVILFNTAFAQDADKTNPKELKHGIQFQMGGLLDLRSFNDFTFSYRYRIENSSGIRIGIRTEIYNSDQDITYRQDSLTANPPGNFEHYRFIISLQYLLSLISYNNFDLIIGGGPFFSYSKEDLEQGYLGSSYIAERKGKITSTGYGVDLICGVEYKLVENVILSGEYGLTIFKGSSDIESKESYTYHDGSPERFASTEGEENFFTVRGMQVNLGLAVFF